MPLVNPHPVLVTVYDTDGTTAKSGATVYIKNNTKVSQSDSETTDGNGQVLIDLANIELGDNQTVPYSAGDSTTIVAYTSTSSITQNYTVAGTNKDQEVTLETFTARDALTTLKNLFEDNWRPVNTDDITPTVANIMDYKTIDAANGDYILLYMIDEPVEPFGLGGINWAHDRIASADIRTTYKKAAISDIRAHLMKLKTEALRILKANVIDPDSNHHLLVTKRVKDLSDRSIGMGRVVIDASLKYWS